MRRRPLGTTGYRVSEIGFGGWSIGGEMWRGVARVRRRASNSG